MCVCVCVVNSANIVRCTCCKLRHWDIPTFQHCNRKPRKQDHRSPLQLCAAHCRSLTNFFLWSHQCAEQEKRKQHETTHETQHLDMIWVAAWPCSSSLREFFQACLQVLLQKKWASLGLTEAVARMWRRIVFSPFLSTFPFKSCRDWTMWYSAACQANGMSHSRKERTCDLDGSWCDVHRIRVAHNDVLPMVIFCTPAPQLTPILMILTTSIVLLFNAYEPCTSLNWKNVLNTCEFQQPNTVQPCFHRPSVVLLRFSLRFKNGSCCSRTSLSLRLRVILSCDQLIRIQQQKHIKV